jgi:hypothetical protein
MCGANADCRVVSHTPTCYCLARFSGDPFVQCFEEQCKAFFLSFFVVNEIDGTESTASVNIAGEGLF